MASTSHRRCQYQGDGCMGTAHAGHDQCAHCYFQYIKPAIAAERADVKRRRELKLSAKARARIYEVDLQEPQIRPEPPLPARGSNAIKRVIQDIELDQLLDGKTEDQQLETLVSEMIKLDIPPVPLPRPPAPPVVSPPKEAPTQNDMPDVVTRRLPTPPPKMRGGPANPPLSAEAEVEVVEAYKLGQPVAEICRAYTISAPRLYEAVRAANVPLRGNAARKDPPMPQSTPPVSPPPVEKAPSNGVVSGLTEWVVTYEVRETRTIIVQARDFNTAAAAVQASDYDVISVAKSRP